MNSHTSLRSREAAKIKSDSPEKMQQAIDELQKNGFHAIRLIEKNTYGE